MPRILVVDTRINGMLYVLSLLIYKSVNPYWYHAISEIKCTLHEKINILVKSPCDSPVSIEPLDHWCSLCKSQVGKL